MSEPLKKQYIDLLQEFRLIGSRDEKNAKLNTIISKGKASVVSQELYDKIIAFEEREMFHVKFVKAAMSRLKRPNNHDWSKDKYYVYVLLGRFGLGITAEDTEFNKEFLAEVNRHYECEPHHPEYETFHKDAECTEDDIIEMAIDRLTRNIVANQGKINFDEMRTFAPQFHSGDKEGKLKTYWKYVYHHSDLVLRVFREDMSK